jgi:hypothetical protein
MSEYEGMVFSLEYPMTRPALLFLAQRLPYPPHRGDKIRALQIIKHFGRDYDVHVGTMIDDMADRENIEGLRPFCRGSQKAGCFYHGTPGLPDWQPDQLCGVSEVWLATLGE